MSTAQRISRRESVELLRAGRYAELDARMNAFQQAYRAHTLGDLELMREFGTFAHVDPLLDANLDAWVTQYPDSYAAHLGRGTYHFRCGVEIRGTKYIDRTSAEQIRGMKAYLARSREDLLASLTLDTAPLISYHYLILIGMELGERAKNRECLQEATALDADSIVIRRPYMTSLETRWGGSIRAMERFLEESRAAGASPEHQRMLASLIDRERHRSRKKPADASGEQPDDAS